MVVHRLTYSLTSSIPIPLHRERTLPLSGRSALHWACSVNHLSLTRTLIRYGAAVDLQDNKVHLVRHVNTAPDSKKYERQNVRKPYKTGFIVFLALA